MTQRVAIIGAGPSGPGTIKSISIRPGQRGGDSGTGLF